MVRPATALLSMLLAIGLAGCGGGDAPAQGPGTSPYATLFVSAAGEGTVTSSPAGISCGADCEEKLSPGSQVTLQAVSSATSQFSGWSGTGVTCQATVTCTITMDADRSVSATFIPKPATARVTVVATGSGTVTSAPAGIACGGDCTEDFAANTAVSLSAVPASGYQFLGWSGSNSNCQGLGNCSFVAAGDSTINAQFNALPVQTVPLSVSISGSGTVTTSSGAINCPGDCGESYTLGSMVTLKAVAATAYIFSGWSGGGCSGTGDCSVTLSAPRAVQATFSVVAPSDTQPPTVTSSTPSAGATGASTNSPIVVGFSEAMDCASINTSTVTVSESAGTVSCSGTGLAYTPAAALSYSKTYTVTLAASLRDVAGNFLAGVRSWTFTTGAAPDQSGPFSFLVYGDSRSGNGCDGNKVHISLVQRMLGESSAKFVFNTGDMVTGYDKSTNWIQRGDCTAADSHGSLKEIIAPLQNKTPAAGLPTFYFPVVGNHDDNWGDGWYPDKFGNGYCDVFDPKQLVPNHTQKREYFQDWTRPDVTHYSDAQFYTLACSTTTRAVYPDYMYYSFDYKNTHFVVMRVNSDYYNLLECSGSCTDQANYDAYYYKHQLDWLRYDLAQVATRPAIQNTVVLTHAPLLSYSDGHSANVSWQTLMQEFKKYKVKLVLSGHNHVYERSYPVVPSGTSSAPVRDDVNGTVYVVTGGGGSALHGFRTVGSLNAKRFSNYHYVKIDVSGASFTITTVGVDGTVLDSVTW